MEINQKIGANIRKLRNLKELKQSFVAEQLNKSEKWLGQVERGEADIRISELEEIAKLLDFPLSDFFIGNAHQIFNNYHQQGTYIASQHNMSLDKTIELFERIIHNLEE